MPSTTKHDVIDLGCNEHSSSNIEADPNHLPPTDNSDTPISCYSFPVKLHYMLTEVEKDGLSHIVSWQPHGRCFMVHNRKAFVESFLSNWFLQSKFTSFQRQLNIYGFRRITSGRDKGAYYHKLFLRGKPLLSCRIPRTTVKGKGPRKPSSPGTEPDFYSMPPLPPTNRSSAISVTNPYLHSVGQNLQQNIQQSVSNPSLLDCCNSLYFYQHGLEQQNSTHCSGRVLSHLSSLNPTNNNSNCYGDIWSHDDGIMGTEEYNVSCFTFPNGS